MDFLREQLVIMQERLRGLTPSQKLLAAALVVIMMMTMLYWGRFASSADMVLLLPTPVSPADLPAVTSALTAADIKFSTDGGFVRVPADSLQDAVLAARTAAALAGGASDSPTPLESMLDKFNPLGTQTEFAVRGQAARNRTVINAMKTWPGVSDVTVQVTESQRGNTLTPQPAGAWINITSSGKVNARNLAASALAAICPSVQNLPQDNVTVSVNGVPVIKAGSKDGGLAFGASDLMESKNEFETRTEQKIRDSYSIPGMRILVTADVDGESKIEKSTTPDKKNTVSLPSESTSEKTQTTEAGPIGEPGAVPNTGIDATAGASMPRSGSKTERTEDRFENKIGITEIERRSGPGQTKIVGVSVGVPREHFAKALKRKNKGVDPSDDDLDAYVKAELEKMRTAIAVTTNLKDPSAIVVNDFISGEDASDLMVASVATAAAPGAIAGMATAHGKEVAIGGLALTSLFMVGRMVKKSSPQPTTPLLALDDMPDVSSGSRKSRKSGTLGGVDIAGEVAEGGSIMMGQELDEEVLETSQMVEQVSGFVKENPDTTAQLLKRWMNRE